MYRRGRDHSVAGSAISSAPFLAMCQRRLGLYLSCLAPVLDEKARRGALVTQHQRLGDEYLNAANNINRHNDGLRATFTALTALSTATQPPGALKLGDRGDGTRVSKEEARRRYAHINNGHVPDIVRHGTPPSCYEYKGWTPFLPNGALGLGSTSCGGAASKKDAPAPCFRQTPSPPHPKLTLLGGGGGHHIGRGGFVPLDPCATESHVCVRVRCACKLRKGKAALVRAGRLLSLAKSKFVFLSW